jgi:protein involved in polysaccharide export with SLBB domain
MPFLAVGQTVWVSVWGFEDSRQVTFYGSRQVGRDGRLSFPPPGGQADSIAVQAAGATPSDVRAAIIECLAARYTDLHVAVWSEGIDAVYQGLATRAPQPAAASRPSSRPSTLAASAPAR